MPPDQPNESPPFSTMSEAIKAFEDCLPENIKKLYCVGPIWAEIVRTGQFPLNQLVPTPAGPRPAVLFLAAYAINIVAQEMNHWCLFDTKINPETMNLIPMDSDEKKLMEEQQIPMVIEFVSQTLGIPIIFKPEPFMQL